MYPQFLNPAYSETFQINGADIEIPKCVVLFQKWNGIPVKETFGGKSILTVDGKPMFAEMAVVTHFVNSGWQSRWLETYGRGNKEPISLAEWKDESYANQENNPIPHKGIQQMLVDIAKLNNNSYAGCWHALSWKDGTVIFAEAKRNNKDVFTPAQNRWLAAALKLGLTPANFLLVQWDFNPRV